MADEGQLPTLELGSLTQAAEPTERAAPRIEGVVIAKLVDLRDGAALISYPELEGALGADACVLASSARALTGDDLGAQLAVVFVGGDPDHPLVIGKLEHARCLVDGERRRTRELVLEADRKITIRCGRSSISLSEDGRLEIRGQHLLSRAASVNRIRGGVIQLN